MMVQDASGWYAYFLTAFLSGSGNAIIAAMLGYAVKRIPKMIRGITNALFLSLSAAGGILYQQITKPFFETAPNMVFVWIGIFDVMVLIFIVIMIYLGKYGDAAPQEDTDGEGNSQV